MKIAVLNRVIRGRSRGLITATLLFAAPCWAAGISLWDWLPPFYRLREQQRATEARLALTPPAPPVQFGPRIGWHSSYSPSPERVVWVELAFKKEVALDLIALVPVPPHSESLTPGAGFPIRFKIEAFSSGNPRVGRMLFDHTGHDFPNPNTLPVAVRCERQPLNKVRITATRLSGSNGRYHFALGEIFLFDGKRNLGAELDAYGIQSVTTSSSEGSRPDWGRINLVDSQSCLGLPEGTMPSPSLGFSSARYGLHREAPEVSVTVDLGEAHPVEEIRIFPARPPSFSHSINFGFPELYRVELRETEASEPVWITPPDSTGYVSAQGGSCSVILGNGRSARYVALVGLKTQIHNGYRCMALSEMEVWSGGKNVALQKRVISSNPFEKEGWSPDALVDGFTSRSNIVDQGLWLEGLSERRELGDRLSEIAAKREKWIHLTKTLLAAGASGGAFAGVFFLRFDRRRQRKERELELQALRRRFAQDLHDDIGSNLGGIVLMAEQALEVTENPEVIRELRAIRETASDSVEGLRLLVEANRDGAGTYLNFETQIRALTDRALRGLCFDLQTSIPRDLSLPAPLQRQLLLSLKEMLHNIRRHAHCRNVSIALSEEAGQIRLEVQDDGCGFDVGNLPAGGNGLSNLRHRATALGGQVSFKSAPGKGTVVTMSVTLDKKAS